MRSRNGLSPHLLISLGALIVSACSSDAGTGSAGNDTAAGSGTPASTTMFAAGKAGASAGTTASTQSARAGAGAAAPSGASAGAPAANTGSSAASSPGAGGSAAGSGGTANVASAGASGATGAAGAAGATVDPGAMAVACDPADKTAEPTPASYKQIGGYESMTKEPTTGPLKPVLESDPGLADWTVYRPEMLGGERKHAILVWANGGCLRNGTLYGQWLLELASHGFIAIADGEPQSAGADPAAGGQRGFGADGKPQQMAIDWIIAENDRPCSQYYQKLDVTKIAVAGQSCGGLMALGAAGDERVTTALIFNSGLLSPDQAVYEPLHTPLGYFIGGSTDSAYANANSDFEQIDSVPLFLANLDVGHGATWGETNAGEFGRVGLLWLKWQLWSDSTAEKTFKGADCELCKPPSEWVIKKKMLD